MRSIYRSVDDIDLFPAGIAERPVPGALLGHTFLCIVGDQFARLKKGDRFFYDLGGQPHSFTEGGWSDKRRDSAAARRGEAAGARFRDGHSGRTYLRPA